MRARLTVVCRRNVQTSPECSPPSRTTSPRVLHLHQDGQRGRRKGGRAPRLVERHARERGHYGPDMSLLSVYRDGATLNDQLLTM